MQSSPYNDIRLAMVIAAVLTSNTGLASMPGNVFLPAVAAGLPKDSVANVTALVTLNEDEVEGPVGEVPSGLMRTVNHGLRRVLGI